MTSPGRRAKRVLLVVCAAAVAIGGGSIWQAHKNGLVPPTLAQESDEQESDEGDGAEKSGNASSGNASSGGGRPPATVATATAEAATWRPAIRATGSLAAVRGVAVVPDSSGLVAAITFEAGDRVRAGDPLVRLRAAEAEATLAALEARRDEARSEFERDRRLYEQGNQSEAELDQSRARFEELKAEIRRQEAHIAKKTVRAPFDGRLGLREVHLGQYLSPGTPLVTLQALSPLHVNFSLPEQRLPDIAPGQRLDIRVDAYPERTFTGEITAIDPLINEETRQIRVQGTLANDDEALRPGMFARVSVTLPAHEDVITLPQTAIVNQPFGDIVYVVTAPDAGGGPKRVEQRFVTTGARRGTQIEIVEGLDGGEEVVSAGQLKLRNNAPVRVDNDVQPENQPEAAPEEP